MKRLLLIAVLITLSIIACKKDSDEPVPANTVVIDGQVVPILEVSYFEESAPAQDLTAIQILCSPEPGTTVDTAANVYKSNVILMIGSKIPLSTITYTYKAKGAGFDPSKHFYFGEVEGGIFSTAPPLYKQEFLLKSSDLTGGTIKVTRRSRTDLAIDFTLMFGAKRVVGNYSGEIIGFYDEARLAKTLSRFYLID